MNSEEREIYKKLFRDGYLFDVEKKRFYCKNIDSFTAPDGFENWETEVFEEKRYYKYRVLTELGITEKENEVLLFKDAKKQGKLIKNKIFTTNKYGDIEIGLFSLDRVPFTFHQTIASHTNIVEKEDVITRYTPWRTQLEGRKYHISGKTGTHPFLHPKIIEAYESEEEITTLSITEGAFKAFKATQEGIYTIGLSSITHYKSKEDGELHADIIEIIKKCKVKNVVILWDGDCLDISKKALLEEEDLIKRPLGFYSAGKKIREHLKEFVPKNTKIFFAHINSKSLSNGYPKGIDDLLVKYNDSIEAIKADFLNIGDIPGRFIKWLDLTPNSKMKRFYNYFKLNNAEQFYNRHSSIITNKEFILSGATYKYDYAKSELITLVPQKAKDYARIGTDFYYLTNTPDKDGILSQELLTWTKATILMDHKEKGFIDHIPKYKKFVNVPSHENYQRIVAGCYNKYYEIDHKPEKGKWDNIKMFLEHIFEEHYEYALDYIQLLYTKPQEPLPILCLVSKEQNTGKSTFINFLRWIFQNNMANIGNAEIENNFNSGWITKLIIACEETFLDKKATMEKIKALSTSEKITMEAKGKDTVEVDFFGKFVFASNNEETFIKISDEDERYWIRKIKSIPKEDRDVTLTKKMKEEIPYFIHFLMDREMLVKEKIGRMWFDTEKLRTEAFYKVAKQSIPLAEKEIKEQLTEMFTEFNQEVIEMSIKDIKEHFNLKSSFEKSYIKRIITENLNAVYSNTVKRYQFPKWSYDNKDIDWQKRTGRPYIFERKNFEIDEVDNEALKELKEHGVTAENDLATPLKDGELQF